MDKKNTPSEFYKGLLDNLYDGVYYVDRLQKFTLWNKSAEKIRMFIEKTWLKPPLENIFTTISIGGTMAVADESIDNLMKRADEQRYLAKKTGRNAACII